MIGSPTFIVVAFLLLAPWITKTQAQNATTQPDTMMPGDETFNMTATTMIAEDLNNDTATTMGDGLDDEYSRRVMDESEETETDNATTLMPGDETSNMTATTMIADLDNDTATTDDAGVEDVVDIGVEVFEDDVDVVEDTVEGVGAALPGGYGAGLTNGSTSYDPSDDEKEIKDWITAIVNKEAEDINVRIQEILAVNDVLEIDIKAMKEKVEMLENTPLKKCPLESGATSGYSSTVVEAPAAYTYTGYRRRKRYAYSGKTAPAYFSVYKTEPFFPDKSKPACNVPFDGSNIHRSVSLDLTSGTVRIQQPGVYYLSFTCLKMTGYPIKVQITRNSEVVGSGQHSLGKITLDSEGLSTVLAQNNIWSSVYVEALVYLAMGDSVRVKMYSDGALYDDQSRYTHFIGYKL